MTETTTQVRIIGGAAMVVSLVGLVVAFAVQPFMEWGPFGYVLGACVLGLGVVGAWTLVSGRGHVLGENPRRERMFALIGVAATAIVIVTNVLQDWEHWTAADILVIAVWLSLGITYVTTFWMVRNDA